MIEDSVSGNVTQAISIGEKLAELLSGKGAGTILSAIKLQKQKTDNAL